MKQISVTRYESIDGKLFDYKKDCIKYETELNEYENLEKICNTIKTWSTDDDLNFIQGKLGDSNNFEIIKIENEEQLTAFRKVYTNCDTESMNHIGVYYNMYEVFTPIEKEIKDCLTTIEDCKKYINNCKVIMNS